MSHVPHVWVPATAWVADGLRLRRPPTDLVCRRCGTVVVSDIVEAFDRTPGWQDCDHMLALVVMES